MAIKLLHLVFLILLLLAPISINAKRKTPSDKKPSGLDFIKKLKGCHKGNHTKEVHQLKAYLEKFGYLEKTKAEGDNFDEALESAIKTYQKNYHIKPSGFIDDETVSTMTTPRCGVPDIVNGNNHMEPKHIHAVSDFNLFKGRPKWPAGKTHLTYTFLTGFPQMFVEPTARAFQRWQSATRFTFSRAGNGESSDITIGYYSGDHGDGFPFDGRGNTLAHAFAPTNGRFHYDADEAWSVGGGGSSVHVESVAVHEIGHLLGLNHSSVPEAIMWPSIKTGEVKTNLNQDDLNGIAELYGA